MRAEDEGRDKRPSLPEGDLEFEHTRLPIPDPTKLTTAQLYREISALSEIFESKLRALQDRVTVSEIASKEALTNAAHTIQSGLDKAEKSIVVSIDKVQNEQRIALTDAEKRVNEKFGQKDKSFDEKINQNRMLSDEKFNSINTQFVERDKRTEQLSLADKTAIAAALQAQKEAAGATNESNAAAIAKSEAGFTKQIDQIQVLISTLGRALDDKIDDLKVRVTQSESRGRGIGDTVGWLIGAAGLLVAVLVLILKVVGK